MKTIKLFGYEADGSSRVWWSWQDLRRDQGPPPPGICTHGRAWLYFPDNNIGVEWVLGSRRCAIGLSFSTTDDDAINFDIGIPFVGSLYLSLGRAAWVKHLPGVKWNDKQWNSGERDLDLYIHDWALWWRLWRHPHISNSHDWRDGCFHFDDFILGRSKHSRSEKDIYDTYLVLPEGAYPVKVALYTSSWKRPRWPWARSIARASIDIEKGIPVPGNIDSDFYDGDDALFGSTFPAATVEEALLKLHDSVIHDRLRHGGPDWVPDAGWPTHCLR